VSIGHGFYFIQQFFKGGVQDFDRLFVIDDDVSLDFHITGYMDFISRWTFLTGAWM